MKVVHYIPGYRAGALPDAQVEATARAFLTDDSRETIEVSNELFLLAVRTLVAEGVASHDVVFYLADGMRVMLDQYGRTLTPLDTTSVNLLMRLLKAPGRKESKDDV